MDSEALYDREMTGQELAQTLNKISHAGARKTPTRLELNAEQHKLWTQTRTALMWSAPAFASIFYSMMADNDPDSAYFTDEVERCGTDGKHLFINPEGFFSKEWNIHNRVAAVAHEIAHAMFDHCGMQNALKTRGVIVTPSGNRIDYDEQIYAESIDYVVNALLAESNIGKIPDNWFYDPNIAKGTDSVFEVYERLYEKREKQENGGGGGGGDNGSQAGPGTDNHCDPGTGDGGAPSQAQSDRSEQEWKNAVAGAMASAQAQGKLPEALKRLFAEQLEPKVSWQEHLRAMITRRVGNDTRSWKKLDRRLIVRGIGAPGKIGFGCGLIDIAIDTSGSVTGPMVDQFLAEVRSILEDVRPQRVRLIWCDAKVHRVDEVDDVQDLEWVRALGAAGGGGTAFEPVFEHIYESGEEPETLLYLTDGLGSFPDAPPDYPVVWGSIYAASTYPFGEVVNIDMQS
ncbi:vWA domain-containing protein [Methylocystis heyeri]|uniref:Metallopeptidase domain-containing protein n=1 Tax=Methylocystis heyeri TaxID=391905 RepID=A0A6B8KI24_9HYPH|nr:VWA-like domain-containing protein [Methylocystis heyeri]QGM46150.1 hypothetical protein H2LOC_010830 [Methylocystis heyeri]